MKERAIQFGKSAVLAGVLSEPEGGAGDADRPAFILLNSGILHRVGSCRLHVRMARRLAARGFTSLRFDFSGIGDSEPRRDSLSYEESSRLEVREAMDHLHAARGIKRFVLMGLCSGADMAHLTATEDTRVCGLVLLDAWAYRTPRYWFHYYAQRVFKAGVWRNWAGIRMRRMMGEMSARRGPARSTDVVTYEVPKYVRNFPPRDKVAAELSALIARGVQMFVIFTGGVGDHLNHRSQYRHSFHDVDFRDQLRHEFMPAADHILTNLQHQEGVVGQVAAWAEALYPSPLVPSAARAKAPNHGGSSAHAATPQSA